MIKNKQTFLYLSVVLEEVLILLRKILCCMAYIIFFLREGKISFDYNIYKTPFENCNLFSLARGNNRPGNIDNTNYIMHIMHN